MSDEFLTPRRTSELLKVQPKLGKLADELLTRGKIKLMYFQNTIQNKMPEYDTIRDMKMCLKFFLQIFFAMFLISLLYCVIDVWFGLFYHDDIWINVMYEEKSLP